MVVETAEIAAAIRDEWRQVFDLIPAGGDTTQLREDLKPKWAELPTLFTRTATSSGDTGDFVSSALENPTVNPIHGMGRSSADVQRELAGHRGYIRRTAGTGLTPIFQSDYLFVQLPSKPIILA